MQYGIPCNVMIDMLEVTLCSQMLFQEIKVGHLSASDYEV